MTRVTVNLRIISIISKRLSKPPVCFANRDMFHVLTRVTSLAVPLPVSPGTAHSSDAHHLAAGASVELRWSVVSYTQVSADVSWSRSHYSLSPSMSPAAQEYQYLEQGEVKFPIADTLSRESPLAALWKESFCGYFPSSVPLRLL